ncbi:MAG: type II secretion system protein [Thioalkalispiraceae bacterium]|jgi:MSHA pilin protein MshC
MNKNNLTGFTLVELIVVILLVGIISVFILPRFFSADVFAERRVKDEIISALRYTQQLAMNRGVNHRLQINASTYAYQRFDPGSGNWLTVRNPDGSAQNNYPDNISLTPTTVTYDQLGQPVPNTAPAQTITVGSQLITIELDTGYAH